MPHVPVPAYKLPVFVLAGIFNTAQDVVTKMSFVEDNATSTGQETAAISRMTLAITPLQVGADVDDGSDEGESVGTADTEEVGAIEGSTLLIAVGTLEGLNEGTSDVMAEGSGVGSEVGSGVGNCVGLLDETDDGAAVESEEGTEVGF
jgi:hypothetical protein